MIWVTILLTILSVVAFLIWITLRETNSLLARDTYLNSPFDSEINYIQERLDGISEKLEASSTTSTEIHGTLEEILEEIREKKGGNEGGVG